MRTWMLIFCVACAACISEATVGADEDIRGELLGPVDVSDAEGIQVALEWTLPLRESGSDVYVVPIASVSYNLEERTYVFGLSRELPDEALNPIDGSEFFIGVGFVVAYPNTFRLPMGRQEGVDGLSTMASESGVGHSEHEYAIIYRRGSDADFPRDADVTLDDGGWMLDFAEGFGCGIAVNTASDGHYYEPVPCAAIPLRFEDVHLEVPQWR